MKRITKLLLTLALVLLLLPNLVETAAATTSGSCGSDLTWQLEESTGTLTISGTGEKESDSFYSNRKSIRKIVMEEGITSIPELAFDDCINLSSVEIPASVAKIGMNAFLGCEAI